MKIFLLALVITLLSACSKPDSAASEFASQQSSIISLDKNTQNLQAYPQLVTLFETNLKLDVSDIRPAAMPDLLEVITSGGIFYASADGEFLLSGNLYQVQDSMVNHTELTRQAMRIQGMNHFAQSTVNFPAENEKHKIVVFTDITCGYCRQMHGQIEQYNALGISIEYMAFPRYGLQHPSFKTLESIWCSENQKQAMTAAKAGNSITPAQCDNQLAEQFAFARQIGVNSTPSLLLSDGQLMPGYLPPQRLLQVLDQQ